MAPGDAARELLRFVGELCQPARRTAVDPEARLREARARLATGDPPALSPEDARALGVPPRSPECAREARERDRPNGRTRPIGKSDRHASCNERPPVITNMEVAVATTRNRNVRSAWLGIGLALLLQIGGFFTQHLADDLDGIGSGLVALGHILFLLACVDLAKSKGQPWYLGLAGVLGVIGLPIILAIAHNARRPQDVGRSST